MDVSKHIISVFSLILVISCNSDDTTSTVNDNGNTSSTLQSVVTLGGSNNDSAQSVVATSDGGYAILGYTQSNDGDITDKQDESFDYWMIKYDAQHTIEWQRTYGGSGNDRGQAIIQTQDSGYAVIGSSASNDGDVSGNSGAQDFWFAKLDALGNLSWQRSFGFSGADIGLSVIQTRDLGYLLTGILDVTASGGQGNTTSKTRARHAGGDYWALKLDTSGNLEWSHYYGGNFTDTPRGIVQTNDGGFIIAGGTDSNDTDISAHIGSYDFWVVKLSATGQLVWERSFGGLEIDEAYAISTATDGNYVIVGESRSRSVDVSANTGADDVWVIKISPQGELLWEQSLGGASFDAGRAIVTMQNEGFVIAGSSRSNTGDVSENKGQNDAWVVQVDANGAIQWEIAVGGSNIDFAYGVAELADGTVIAVGDTASNDQDITIQNGFTDALVIRID